MASMNVKRWILWACLAVIFVSQVLLFRANSQLSAAQTDARDARQQLTLLQTKLDELQASSVATLSTDNARLRQDNQTLTQKLAKANNDLTQLGNDKSKLAQQLQTARQALQLQQDHLQQLSVENQQQAQALAPPPPQMSPEDAQNACIENLKEINNAKQEWALEKNKDAADAPTADDLLPYLKGNVMPVCPAGGAYTIGAMNENPACSVPGHALP
jgi:septal ring factor EnvC (AmiA/AmiB activator)